jgi:tryptophanyl-tRNA synthetase
MKRIVSGIQPTGNLHLGNYLGALKNWVNMQHTGECFFFIVDLHAITVPQDPVFLHQHIHQAAATYIAAGINPEKTAIFPQSAVPQHSELMWIFACNTALGWLNRMTQFKDKAKKGADNASLGLYAYPVLMAADILLYKAHEVPVGEDQKQHLELARDIAGAFNRQYKTEYFTLPDPKIMGPITRVMSLRDGTQKMSKSDPVDGARINLLDTPEIIQQKIRKAKTDTGLFPDAPKDLESRPEVDNLLHIFAAVSNLRPQEICTKYGGKNFSDFKKDLADALLNTLEPMQQEYHRLMDDRAYLDKMLAHGIQKATTVAEKTMSDVRSMVGLYHPG